MVKKDFSIVIICIHHTHITYIFDMELGIIYTRYQKVSSNLLITTNMSIIDILYEVGFDSESYFYRLYKKHFGQTPLNDRMEGKVNS